VGLWADIGCFRLGGGYCGILLWAGVEAGVVGGEGRERGKVLEREGGGEHLCEMNEQERVV